MERIGAGSASLASMIGPVSTILPAFVFLGERVSGWQLIGTALVLAGVAVLSRERPARGSVRCVGPVGRRKLDGPRS